MSLFSGNFEKLPCRAQAEKGPTPPLRLSSSERDGILQALKETVRVSYCLYLFGSRTDDANKGGDIDLLLVVGDQDLNSVRLLRYDILVKIKAYIGDQKIDLAIFAENSVDPFFKIAKHSAQILTTFRVVP